MEFRNNFLDISTSKVRCLTAIITLLLSVLAAVAQPEALELREALQVKQMRIFSDTLAWVGPQTPSDAESREILDDAKIFQMNGVQAGYAKLETFITEHPDSPWVPALRVHLAENYKSRGHYSLALAHWRRAWDETKDSEDVMGQKIAARTLAGWTRLLASLGRKDEIEALFKELEQRHVTLGIYQTEIEETKEGLGAMKRQPGGSYRCGSFALGHMARALGFAKETIQNLFEIESPDGGFNMAQLLKLAETNGMTVTAVHATDNDLVVPSVVHWNLNHYAAITEKKGDLYRVEDPTFGGHTWMTADAIVAESSGDYIISGKQIPHSWYKLTELACTQIYGKGHPNIANNSDDTGPQNCQMDSTSDATCQPPTPNDGDLASGSSSNSPCCGMPQWYVSEPYITLWLEDAPLFYHQSDNSSMRIQVAYKARGDAQNSDFPGFGDKWSCNWIGMIEDDSSSGTDTVVDHVAGGGHYEFVRTPGGGGVVEYKTGRIYETVTVAGASRPALLTPYGSQNVYGYSASSLDGTTMYFLTQRIDQYGRVLGRFNYDTTNGITRLRTAIDMDGQTNTLSYNNAAFPNLITSITDRYGRTANFNYNSNGLLSSIQDAQGMTSYFYYDTNENITSMSTPYGTTGFAYYESGDGTNTDFQRAMLITEASGDHQLYAYSDYSVEYGDMSSFHWNRAEYQAISPAGKSNVLAMTNTDYQLASYKHWLHGDSLESGGLTVSDTLQTSADPYDPVFGTAPNMTTYTYQGQGYNQIGDPSEGGLQRVTSISVNGIQKESFTRNALGRPTSYTLYNPDGSTAMYSNIFDSSGTILKKEIGPRGELTRGYGYDPTITNLMTSVTNAVGDVTLYSHNTNTMQVTGINFPTGLVRTNTYYTNGANAGFLAQQIDIGFSTNSFAYTNGNLLAETNQLGLVTTYIYDNLNRPISAAYPDGTTISNVYDKLDVVAAKNRLNQWTYYGYNSVRQLMAVTNVNGEVTTYDYCGCGAPDEITRWNGSSPLTTHFSHKLDGILTNVTYPDGYQLNYVYNYDDLPDTITDGAGHELDLFWGYHGVVNLVEYANLGGQTIAVNQYDEYGRVTNNIDRNNVPTYFSYDYLDRITNRTVNDPTALLPSSVETFAFNARGLTNYVDALSNKTTFVRDAADRVLYETNANNEVLQFTYNPSGEMQSLTDGKNQTTKWTYDTYGRVTNKVDAANNVLFVYQYDANDRLTNRWSAAKTNTVFAYDPIGNLTNVVYLSGSTSNFVYSYDALNRLTNMVDGSGATAFTWTDGDQLASETGPWANDSVNFYYDNARQRSGLSLAQPNASAWTQSYSYDTMMRLTGLLSPAGTFGYSYGTLDTPATSQPWAIWLPNGAAIGLGYDGIGRLITVNMGVASPYASPALELQYAYDGNSQRTQEVWTVDSSGSYTYKNYTYDKIGQLKTDSGHDYAYDYTLGAWSDTARAHEQFGYTYDAAWNLNVRTNNALIQTFNVNNLNELTSATRAGSLTVAGAAGELRGSVSGSPAGVTNVTVSGTGLTAGSAQIYHEGEWARTGATLSDGNNSYTAIGADTYGRSSQDSVTVNLPATNTFVYDLNGNLRTNNTRIFDYDDENQLIRVTEPGLWKTEYVYDGMLRMRERKKFGWNGSSWAQTNEVHYIYDGQLVIQERDTNNLPLVTYTRGNDLSGTLQGAGGIGGLLARTENGQLVGGSSTATALYAADANGNITRMFYTNGMTAARYDYDPYGNMLTMSGPLATANKYRFSSKECQDASGLYYYGFRFYEPGLQRWLNRDTIQEWGGINLYRFAGSNPLNRIDSLGLCEDIDEDEDMDPDAGLTSGLDYRDPNSPEVQQELQLQRVIDANNAALAEAQAEQAKTQKALNYQAPESFQSNENAPNRYIVSKNGTVFPIPKEATGPGPVNTGKGFSFTGGSGGNGLSPQTTSLRIMDPTARYPNGYGVYMNSATPTAQTVNPFTGQVISPSDPFAHIPCAGN